MPIFSPTKRMVRLMMLAIINLCIMATNVCQSFAAHEAGCVNDECDKIVRAYRAAKSQGATNPDKFLDAYERDAIRREKEDNKKYDALFKK